MSAAPIILDCAHKAVTALFAKATAQASGAGGSWKYWHGQWKCSRGKARAHKLFLMLKAGDDRMSAQQFIQGSARYKGCTYQVILALPLEICAPSPPLKAFPPRTRW